MALEFLNYVANQKRNVSEKNERKNVFKSFATSGMGKGSSKKRANIKYSA